MTEQDPDQLPDEDQLPEDFRRNRREHGGAPFRVDDDRLARLTEEERVAAGLDDFDPDEVPPATDAPPTPDITQSEEYEEERAEIEREAGAGELRTIDEQHPYPPSHYER